MRINKLFVYAAGLVAYGTTTIATNASDATISEPPATPRFYRPLTLGWEAGTTGAGGALWWRFADHWGVRGGFDYFEYSDNSFSIKELNYNAKIRLVSQPLTLDFYPSKEHYFHISVGLQFNENRLTGTAEDTGTIVPASKLGTLDLTVEQQLVNPYVGVGAKFYLNRAHHWALGGEMGVAYTGEPSVSLTPSGSRSPLLDAAVKAEQKRVQDYADQFKWWPVLKLTASFSF
jgi:hypothetical protein